MSDFDGSRGRRETYRFLDTCPVSQNPSLLQAVMAVEVVMSKIRATAPPCRFPPMSRDVSVVSSCSSRDYILHSCLGTVKL
jgi:hypothetical protein